MCRSASNVLSGSGIVLAQPPKRSLRQHNRGVKRTAPDGPRHSPDFYDQRKEDVVLAEGERMLVECEGGPSFTRLEVFPPRLEIEERDGTYVLQDSGPRHEWRYVFVPHRIE